MDENFDTPLHRAVTERDLKRIIELLSAGVSVDEENRDGNSPLATCAYQHGDLEVATLLLRSGADPEGRSCSGDPAILNAASQQRTPMLLELLRAKADPSAQGEGGETALHYAVLLGNFDACEALLEAGADPTLSDRDGETPSDWEPRANREQVVALLDRWLSGHGGPDGG